jgi:hypothetical protein
MKSKLKIRFVSGRVEEYEVDFFGGTSTEDRLKKFAADPTIVLKTEEELIVIPSTAIECITIPLSGSAGQTIALPGVRKADRVK